MNPSERFVVYPCLLALVATAAFPQKKRPAPTGTAATAETDGTFRSLQIVDEKGRTRIFLGVDGDGGAYVATYGVEGKERVRLTCTTAEDIGMLRTFGPDGKERARIGNTSNGTGSLEFFSTDGKLRFRYADDPEWATLGLFGPEGKLRVQLAGSKDAGQVTVSGSDGNPCVYLWSDAKGGAVTSSKPDGKAIWTSPRP